MRRSLITTCMLAGASFAPAAIYIDFESGAAHYDNAGVTGQFRDNSTALGLTSNGAANDFIRFSVASGANTSAVAVYDTTPSNGNTTRNTFLDDTVRVDFRSVRSADSFGIVLRLNTSAADGYMFIANINDSGATDRVRIFEGTSSSTAGTERANLANSTALALDTWYTMEASAVNSGTSVVVTGKIFAQGSFTNPIMQATWTDAPGSSNTAAGQIGLRFGRNGTSGATLVDADNFAVPEPSGLAVLGLSALLGRRRRRR